MTEIEKGTLAVLKALIDSFGAIVIHRILDSILGTSVSEIIENDISIFIGSLLRPLVESVGEQKIRDTLEAEFKAADVVGDLAEEKVFGKDS